MDMQSGVLHRQALERIHDGEA